jgi:hypothetical protein
MRAERLSDQHDSREPELLDRRNRVGDERLACHVGRPPLASSVPPLVEGYYSMRLG